MNRKRKFTLIIVMILSFSMFVSNLSGLKMAVRASDYDDFFTGYDEGDYDGGGDSGDQEEEQRRQQEEEQRRQQEEEMRRMQEEAERQAAEEAQRAAEEEAKRQAAAEAETAKKAAEEEQRRQEEAQRQAAEEEAKRQEAYERAAREAEEEARKKEEEEKAAEEAKKKAAEEEARAAEAAEKAKKEAEEAQKKEQESSYAIRTQIDGGSISNIQLNSVVGGGDFQIFSIVNMGSNDIDLVYGISEASARVFALSLVSGSSALKAGSMDKFQVAIDPAASVGNYNCTLYFKDSKDTENAHTVYIGVTATVTGNPTVTNVVVYPQSIRLAQGGTCDFHAEVQGRDGDVSQAVNWNLLGAQTGGTYITSGGTLTVASNETASSLTVIATSIQDSSKSGTANVAIQKGSFNVNVTADPQNGGIVTGGGAVTSGGSVTLSAVPNKNFYFDGWIRDGQKVSTATNYTINNIQCNISVRALFKRNYVTVTAVPENDQAGTVVGGGRITYGGRTTLSARAYDGFVFTGWKEGDSIISKSPSIDLNNLTVDRKIIAKFAKTSYTITLSCYPNEGGSVSGSGRYNLGDSVTLQAKPAPGYSFQKWTVNDQVVSRDPSFRIDRVDRDYSLTAVFLQDGIVTHNIVSGVATTGGAISPSGTIVVGHGSNITYTITPKSGFAILAVAVDGIQVGPVSSYTFSDVKSDHAIAAAFVQTDAGAKAAAAKGEEAQAKKVQKVYKEEKKDDQKAADNEEKKEVKEEEPVVSLEDAASGTAGDSFVQEMDLSDITIPTDEELGIVDEAAAAEESSNVLKRLGMNMDEARSLITSGDGIYILESAFYEGNLDTYVDNQLAPPSEIPDYHFMTREELEQTPADDIYPSMPNLDKVMEKLITPAEMLTIAQDGSANVSVSIRNADNTIDEKSKEVLNGAVGQKPLKYFDLTMMKLVNGMPTNVKELEVPMEVIIKIPDEIYKEGKVYSVLRDHNGALTVLPDLDDDPHTITFATDKLSSYAIAEQVATPKNIAIRFAIGALISLIIALACMVILMHHQIKMKRARRMK